MPRHLLFLCALATMSGCIETTFGEPGRGRDPDADADTEPPCADADLDSVCDDDDNCPYLANKGQADADGDGEGDACEPVDTTIFEVTVWSAEVLPTKDSSNPWDWDGDVPDWIIDVCWDVSEFYPQATTFAEVLEVVDEYGPVLLEDTVPPDPYAWFEVYGPDYSYEYGATDYDGDTLEPVWNSYVTVEVFDDEALCLEVYDSDLVFDDWIGGLCFALADLQALAPYGAFYVTAADVDLGQLFSLTFEIEPG